MDWEVNMQVTEKIDEIYGELVYKNTKIFKTVKMTSGTLAMLGLLFNGYVLFRFNFPPKMTLVLFITLIIMLLVFVYAFWGLKYLFFYKHQKAMKSISYPINYKLIFSDENLKVISKDITLEVVWDKLTLQYETQDYWFIAPHGIVIDKNLLDIKQRDFVMEKLARNVE